MSMIFFIVEKGNITTQLSAHVKRKVLGTVQAQKIPAFSSHRRGEDI